MQTAAELEPVLFAERRQPLLTLAKIILLNPLGHQQHPFRVKIPHCVQVNKNFIQITRMTDNKLQLVLMTLNQLANHFWAMPSLLVLFQPFPCPTGLWIRIRQLGADRHQITIQLVFDRSSGFHRDMKFGCV